MLKKLIIDQFVNTLQYGDAISGEVIAIQRVLRKLGYDSEIVALHVHDAYKGMNITKEQFLTRIESASGAVINHFSIASPLNQIFKDLKNFRRFMIYHNMTPPEWFYGYNYRVSTDLEMGALELKSLIDVVDLAIGDSSFNARELKELGFPNVEVLPLPLDPERWNKTSNPGITKVLKGHGGVNILHVGRFAPNKKIEDILRAFYFYHHKFNKNSRLWLIGRDTDTELYSFELRKMRSDFLLKDAVAFCGCVTDEELKSFYECSDLYLCLSEHEGFCVPLIEAFHFGIPTISRKGSALTETVGDAGILLDGFDPLVCAAAMDELISNTELKNQLLAKAKSQSARYHIDIFTKNLQQLIKANLSPQAEKAKANAGN